MSSSPASPLPSGSAAGLLGAAIVGHLAHRPQRACFVAELKGAVGAPHEDLEAALTQLVQTGVAVVQPHFCADPHFIEDDLRVTALVPPGSDDGEALAMAACERLWQRWTADFLASHRCT